MSVVPVGRGSVARNMGSNVGRNRPTKVAPRDRFQSDSTGSTNKPSKSTGIISERQQAKQAHEVHKKNTKKSAK